MSTSIPEFHGHWLMKSTLEFVKGPLEFSGKRFAELGDTFYAVFPTGKALMTSNPDLIKYVLQGNQKNYTKDRAYDELGLLLGKGLVTSRKAFWKKQRKIAQPAFYKKSLDQLFLNMRELVERFVDGMAKKSGQTVDMCQEMMGVTANVAMKTLFTAEMEGNLLEVYDCMTVSQKYVAGRAFNPLSIPFGYINGKHRKFIKKKKVLDQLLNELVENRRHSGEKGNDFLQMLMDARYEDTGEPMSQQQLMDELVTIFSAGHETSANGLAWTLYLLSLHPEILEKVKKEVQDVVGERSLELADMKNLVYMKQVIEEGMRLYPPVWSVGRQAIEDDEWEGLRIKKDMIVGIYFYYLHRHPELWENPEAFNPDRFSAQASKERPNAHYLPFGAGPRMCIGNYFAMMEMQLILVELLRKVEFSLVPDQRIEMEPLVTLRPKYGIHMRIH